MNKFTGQEKILTKEQKKELIRIGEKILLTAYDLFNSILKMPTAEEFQELAFVEIEREENE